MPPQYTACVPPTPLFGTPQVGLVYQAFAVAQQLIRTIVNVDIVPGSPVVLLGGVQINMPDPLPDFYLPLCFKRFTQGPFL